MTDEPDTAELENRIDKLESTIEKMMPSRRDALKMGGAALLGGAAMSGTASAGTSQVGTIGSASQPVDLESEDINNADTITTQDIVVNGTATGPFGSDLQGCRVFLTTDQSIPSQTDVKVEFDDKVYDSGNNFDTTNHAFTCPQTGVYFANTQLKYVSGGADERHATIGNSSSAFGSGSGINVKVETANLGSVEASTMNLYNQGETISAYARNQNSNDVLSSGNANFNSFFEVVFLGSL